MANAAPFVARPARRIAAGIVDLIVMLLFVILAFGIVSHSGQTPHSVEVLLATYALYHVACLSFFHGVTPGIRLLDMQIVAAADGRELSPKQALVRAVFRPALLYAFWSAATYTGAFPEMRFVIAMAPLFVEVIMMFDFPTRQTLSDVVAGTIVINTPPPQPHRAPAAPMYSASDAEFGARQRRIERWVVDVRSNRRFLLDAFRPPLRRAHRAAKPER